MKTARKMICALMLAALLLTVMSASVFATETDNAWLQVDDSEENVTKVSFLADTAITDGLITVSFDAEQLSYAGLEVNSDCVAYSSVNGDTPGVIKLAWVSAGEYEAQDLALFTLTFNGVSEQKITMSGSLTDREGNALTIGETLYGAELSQLKKAVLMARGLNAEHYTADSFAAMEAALAAAEAYLSEEFVRQEDVDAAVQALYDAVDALVLADTDLTQELQALEKARLKALALEKRLYTEDSFARVEAALAAVEAFLANHGASDEMLAAADALNAAIRDLELNPDAPNTGSFLTMPVILLMALSAAGVAVSVCLLLGKKGRCAK